MIRLFSHRGFIQKGVNQNSLTSLKKAQEVGFNAIEFDIWFIENQLVLKHARPKSEELSKLTKFSEFFCFGNDFTYWLDFKNLNKTNAIKALKLTKEILDKKRIDLEKVYFAPFITDYKKAEIIFTKIRNIFSSKAKLVAVCEKLENHTDQQNLQKFLRQNQIKFLSIFHQLIDVKLIKNLSEIEFFAWTVNEQDRLKTLENLGVKNFATDKILPKFL